MSELTRQSGKQHLLKACIDPVELQFGEASVQCLPVFLVCLTFGTLPVLRIIVFQWVDHFQGAIPLPA